MGKMLIICVETDNSANTDEAYIQKVIATCYEKSGQPIINYSKMKGCDKLSKLQKHLTATKREYAALSKGNKVDIICCFDTDKYDVDPSALEKLNRSKDFCKQHGYDFVWFCRDVEEVFWKQTAKNSEKKKLAKQFLTGRQLEKIDLKDLQAANYAKTKSNLMTVLDKYLERKKQ